MSKGPGVLQIKVMQTLKMYHDLGEALQWTFHPGKSWIAKCANPRDIEIFEQGNMVPLWMLIRDLKVCRPALSRAIHGLKRMGYVFLYGADLDTIGGALDLGKFTKYIRLLKAGERWLSVNKVNNTKLTLKQAKG